jgi:signal transduction histidine kinase
MARKTVRVDFIRTNADDLIVLMNRLIDRHTLLGTASPLKAAEVEALTELVASAATQRRQVKEAEARSQSLNNTVNTLLGIAKGQGATSPNTGLFLLTGMRDTLLKEYRGEEEKLSEWGFNVVTGEAKSPQRKPKNKA